MIRGRAIYEAVWYQLPRENQARTMKVGPDVRAFARTKTNLYASSPNRQHWELIEPQSRDPHPLVGPRPAPRSPSPFEHVPLDSIYDTLPHSIPEWPMMQPAIQRMQQPYPDVDQDAWPVARRAAEGGLWTSGLASCIATLAIGRDANGADIYGLGHTSGLFVGSPEEAQNWLTTMREAMNDIGNVATPDLYLVGGRHDTLDIGNFFMQEAKTHFQLKDACLGINPVDGERPGEFASYVNAAIHDGRVYLAYAPGHQRAPLPQWALPA